MRDESKKTIDNVMEYMKSIDREVDSLQALEIVALASGLKNKHALASFISSSDSTVFNIGKSKVNLPIFELGQSPYSIAEMKNLGWKFHAVLPIPRHVLGDVDKMNQYASIMMLGVDIMEKIGHTFHDHFYGMDFVAMEVSGVIHDPDFAEPFFEKTIFPTKNMTSADFLAIDKEIYKQFRSLSIIEKLDIVHTAIAHGYRKSGDFDQRQIIVNALHLAIPVDNYITGYRNNDEKLEISNTVLVVEYLIDQVLDQARKSIEQKNRPSSVFFDLWADVAAKTFIPSDVASDWL